MTPLIMPDIHQKLVQDVAHGRPKPAAQIIVSILPNGKVICDAQVPTRSLMNGMLATAQQDLAAAFMAQEMQQAQQAANGIQVANDSMVQAAAQVHNGIKT